MVGAANRTPRIPPSWNPANTGLPDSEVYALVIDPLTPDTLYAGTGGDGLFKSTDGGAAWKKLTAGQRDFLTRQTLRLEAENLVRAKVDIAAEIKRMNDAGIQTIKMTGDDERTFLKAASGTAWDGLNKLSPKHGPKLMQLMSAH